MAQIVAAVTLRNSFSGLHVPLTFTCCVYVCVFVCVCVCVCKREKEREIERALPYSWVLQGVPGLSCVFPAYVLESVISSKEHLLLLLENSARN